MFPHPKGEWSTRDRKHQYSYHHGSEVVSRIRRVVYLSISSAEHQGLRIDRHRGSLPLVAGFESRRSERATFLNREIRRNGREMTGTDDASIPRSDKDESTNKNRDRFLNLDKANTPGTLCASSITRVRQLGDAPSVSPFGSREDRIGCNGIRLHLLRRTERPLAS